MTERLSIGELADAFDSLIALSDVDRRRWLARDDLHADDRARLARMLAADAQAEDRFLDEPALVHAQILNENQPTHVEPAALVGQQFGAFRLERLIGQGGMATVFLARRSGADFEQVVAVKLLRRGLFSAVEQKLFRRERRLLASLNHPNIARLIDGGITEAGIPYLVLEYVEGLRLDEYVGTHRLGVRARLELFVRAAAAVEAAHRALIVHRDIKPSNILVSTDGTPKLLDFGVAKLLGEDGDNHTLTAALTPSYAAPEQIGRGPITTAADIYALGVVLHELLTGSRPTGPDAGPPSASIASAQQVSRLSPPAPAPHLRRVLRGDLDTIVQRALHVRPEQRYPSVAALIDDVQRYLDGRPVLAHPPSRWYVLRKFLRRNRLAAGLAGALLLALVASLGGALWQARATRAEAMRANSVRDLLIDVFKTAEQSQPEGSRVRPEDIIDVGMRRVLDDRNLPDESRLEFVGALATVASTMGAYAQMDTLTRTGIDIADRRYTVGEDPYTTARRQRAEALIHLDRPSEAVALLEPMRDNLLASDTRAAYEALMVLSVALDRRGEAGDGSLQLIRRLRERAVASSMLPPEVVLQVMITESDQLAAKHRFKEALERGEAAEKYWRDHELPVSSEILWLYEGIGNAASSLGDAALGEAAYRSAITLSERIHDRPHRETAWFVGLLGSYLVSLGRVDEAEPYVLRGLAMRRQLYGETAKETLFAVGALSRLRAVQGRREEAIAAIDEGIDACRRQSIDSEACVRLLQTRSRLRLPTGDIAGAKVDIEAAIAMQKRVSGDESAMIANQYAYLAEVQRREGRYAESVATADKALALMQRFGAGHWADTAVARLQRAWSNLELGHAQAALDEIADAERAFSEASPQNVKMRVTMKHVAASALARLGRSDESQRAAAEALQLAGSDAKVEPEVIATLKRLAAGTAAN
ncbi:protein kinase domain-containing protein [Dokdonella sp.]|uniref:serine/threonine-protein kinase n=1 Tax=Dokdonella sp. TaxID=2291710 RepID=UPI002F3E2F23